MQNVQKAINKAGLGDKIKVTTALNADVYDTSTDKPSGGSFNADVSDVMKQIVQFLDENNSPFLVNIYPFLSLYQNDDFPKDYAFFDSSSRTITDGNEQYTNVFDANLDTLVWSLKKPVTLMCQLWLVKLVGQRMVTNMPIQIMRKDSIKVSLRKWQTKKVRRFVQGL
jgi:hypothetical protein